MGQIASSFEQKYGAVRGPKGMEYLICQHFNATSSRGIFVGDNSFDFYLPSTLIQISVIILLTRVVYYFLKPLRQGVRDCQLIAGIIVGPTFLRQVSRAVRDLYQPGSKLILHTTAEMGFMFHFFVLGVQMDARIIKKAGRRGVLIGVMAFVMPYVLSQLILAVILSVINTDNSGKKCFEFVALMNVSTSFPVITSILSDLNILNSEIGRIATYTSLVTDCCSWILYVVYSASVVSRHSQPATLTYLISLSGFIFSIFYILRPLILWLTKNTFENKTLDEFQLIAIIVIVLGCGFLSQVLGLHTAVGPFILGIALPDGPPVGATIVSKFHTVTNELMLPLFFAITGIRTYLPGIGGISGVIIEFIILTGYFGKFVGTILTALYCGIPLWDALSLGLIMICKGITEIAMFNNWRDSGMYLQAYEEKCYSIFLLNLLLITGMSRILICYLYDPSKRYMTYTRRSIQHSKQDTHFRTLVCIHSQENVPSIIKILESCNPSRYNPISVFVLHLTNLTARASAILTPHHLTNANSSEPIVNAFNHLEQQFQGSAVVQHFTAVAPYVSMHDDICTIALEKRTTFLIVPFHKQWTIDNTVGSINPGVRIVNKNVINKAPCSIGILVDREPMKGNRRNALSSGNKKYRVGMLFLGGPDDPEALALSLRMAEHQNVKLTVVVITPDKYTERDLHLVTELGPMSTNLRKVSYKERVVSDGVGTTEVIGAMEDDLDLLVVGRQHEAGSPLISGLREWSDCPELGVLGDTLASWEFKFSLLVVQQQPLATGFKSGIFTFVPPYSHVSSENTRLTESSDDDDGDFTPVHSRAKSSEFL